jgi:hypothetical protein
MLLMALKYVPLRRKGTRSETTISVSTIIPPPPMPWMERPTSMTVKLFATAATMAPTEKKAKETNTIGLRPKMCENEAKFGWKTVDVRRNDVPDQNASIAEPFSFCAMI